VRDAVLDRPPDERADELVELGRANDPDRERALEQRLLVRQLRRVVAAVEPVDADDRDDDDPLRAGGGAGPLHVPRRGGEERRRLLLVGRGPGRRVDDGLDPCERRIETLAGDDVDALGTRDRDHVVPPSSEDLDEVGSHPARGSRDGDPLASGFGVHGASFLGAGAGHRRDRLSPG